MAKRNYRKSSKKIQNAVYTARFTIPSSSSPTYLDLSAAACILNRRFYRQGLQWAVSGFTLIAPTSTSGTIEIKKLPTNWVVSNAWEKGMRAWMRQQNEALEQASSQSVKGKFNDFKIFADEAHFGTPVPHFLLPKDGDDNTFKPPQEWLHSVVAVPNDDGNVGSTVKYRLHMMGDDTAIVGSNNSRSLIKAYQESRSVPQSPDPSSPGNASIGLYVDMFNDGMADTEIIANAEFRNDELPYDQDEYPGSKNNGAGMELVDTMSYNTGVTSLGKFHLNGGSFPCGLVKLSNDSEQTVDGGLPQPVSVDLLVHLVPGSHRGYMAESMVDM